MKVASIEMRSRGDTSQTWKELQAVLADIFTEIKLRCGHFYAKFTQKVQKLSLFSPQIE